MGFVFCKNYFQFILYMQFYCKKHRHLFLSKNVCPLLFLRGIHFLNETSACGKKTQKQSKNQLLLFVVSVAPFFSFFFLTKPSFHVSLHQFNILFISKDFNKNNLNVTIIILTLKIVLGVP